MRYILGISAFYHDSAAALLGDGEIIAAAQEERFTRIRHDAQFPRQAVAYCLREAGITVDQIDYVAYYEKPLLKFERIIETYFAYAPSGFRSFAMALPLWIREKLHLSREISQGLGGTYDKNVVYMGHHESHAASAFFPSPFQDAAILTCDGVGEWSTTTWGVGKGNKIDLQRTLSFPHSLGLLYSTFTYFTGFKVNSGEYKLMGLAPYGQPTYADKIRDHLVDVKPDGSYRLNMEYFTYGNELKMAGDRFADLFGGPARPAESSITQREMDLAASIQVVTEEILQKMVQHIHDTTGQTNLCLAGGVALNCVANGKLLANGPFKNIWVQPASGDAGAALGCAMNTWFQLLDQPREPRPSDRQKASLLGPSFTNDQVATELAALGSHSTRIDDEDVLLDRVASYIAEGKVVGWFHGRMEFGPRALGSRSIIGDPRNEQMQSTMNLKIKFRESFRPFAPCVLAEEAARIFEVEEPYESPYMLMVAPVREAFRKVPGQEDLAKMSSKDLRERVAVPRSQYPAVTHVDYSARIQTVDETRHPRFYRLMKKFFAATGCPMVINTSFNVRGEPIVHTPTDAFNCFTNTGIDVLVVENHLLLRSEQPAGLIKADNQTYLSKFGLD